MPMMNNHWFYFVSRETIIYRNTLIETLYCRFDKIMLQSIK